MNHLFSLLFCTTLVGCGTQIALSGQAREDYLNSIKTYGEFWAKPGMTKESWRRDWVACGGMNDGGYISGSRLAGETNDLAASTRTVRELDKCMKEKGYEFSRTRPKRIHAWASQERLPPESSL